MYQEQYGCKDGHTARIIVKLRDRQAPGAVFHALAGSCKKPIGIRPLFYSTSENDIEKLLSRVVDSGYKPPDFHSYFSITSVDSRLFVPLIYGLRKNAAVEELFVEQQIAMPPAVFTTNGMRYCPAYLKAAPLGINALHAWQYKGGKGKGIRIADVEQGWDLTAIPVTRHPESGISIKAFEQHGRSVLSVLLLPENDQGGSGMVPESEVCVFSQWRPDGTYNTADAMLAALKYLRSGDVLLIQAQVSRSAGCDRFWPVEIQPPVFEVIRLATALGVTVIEPAANGNLSGTCGNDLDHFEWQGKKVLNRNHSHFKDSGALMVGAATCSLPHHRMSFSNFGSRVDCYAWGEKVNAFNDFRIGLNGTSSAAAMIAGAVVAIQGIAVELTGRPCSPAALRTLLGNPQMGTASMRLQDQIGAMPDLEKILHAAPFNLRNERPRRAVGAGNY